ncbi:MAG: hypothetical protein M3347_14430, partial [Armatimonadota bacterium]|nr:hypothetical protein [Armatimonadota bacterium]
MAKAIREVLEELNSQRSAETANLSRDTFCPGSLMASPRLVDREQETAAFTEHLRHGDKRLLTLTGTMGVGKTVLAHSLAADLHEQFPHGVCCVELASITSSEMVAAEIGRRMPHFKGAEGDALSDFLRHKQMLLLLDKFEHVIPAAPLILDLLSNCHGLRVIITSQQPLGIAVPEAQRWERRCPVLPLPLPQAADRQDLEKLRKVPSVELFIERAEAATGGEFEWNSANASAVADICVLLEGLPQAIEIAAGLMDAATPQEVFRTLEHQGVRGVDSAEKLKNMFQLSYNRLSPTERTLFNRLSIFIAGFTQEAAAALHQTTGNSQPYILRELTSLVHKSLLHFEKRADRSRYRMLRPLRDYGLEQLERDEAAVLQRHHADYFLKVAQEAEPQLMSPARHQALLKLEDEYDNLRAVLRWSLDPEADPAVGLELAGTLFWFWNLSGYFQEGRQQLCSVLEHTAHSSDTAAYAKALYADGGLAFLQGDYAEARRRLAKSVEMWRHLEAKAVEAKAEMARQLEIKRRLGYA